MASQTTPNILFFLTDDQRFDTINALGCDFVQTPNLDRLVARGTAFTRAHIPGGTSAAVCMPSRAMIHSGRGLFQIEGKGESIPEAHTQLGECLRHAGYETFGTGKWHNGTDAYARSFSDGSDIFFGGMADHWNVPCCAFDPEGRYEKTPIVRAPFENNEVDYRHCDHISPGKHSTDLFVESTADFLNRRDTSKPFFAYVSFMAPHDPRTMPKKYLDMYDPDAIELPPNFLEQHPFDTGALRIRDELLAEIPRRPQEIRRHIAEYAAMITHLDDAIGSVISKLEEKGELDNTVIVLAGDNGLAIGQHGLMGKQSLYDHSVRVPLIMAGPGIPQGQRCKSFCYLLDIYPTVCNLAGVDIPTSVTGRSLVPDMNGESDGPDALYLAYCNSIRGITDGNYKLIEYQTGPTQLFNLEADPWEQENLAHKPEHAERISALRKRMREFRESSDEATHTEGQYFWPHRADLLVE